MNWIVLLSTLLSAVAMLWSVLLIWRVRDWRMAFPTFVLALMTLNRLVRLMADPSRPAGEGGRRFKTCSRSR